MADVIPLFPGIQPIERTPAPGEPRPDMAALFREFADKCERGDFVCAAIVAVMPCGLHVDALITPKMNGGRLSIALQAMNLELVEDVRGSMYPPRHKEDDEDAMEP